MAKVSTRYRDKIGSHLSYPLRCSDIERTICKTIERFDIEVGFFAYKAPRPNEGTQKHRVLEAFYRPNESDKIELLVRPIPRDLNSQLRDRIDELLLGAIASWMREEQSKGWSERNHSLFVSYDSTTDSFDISRHDPA